MNLATKNVILVPRPDPRDPIWADPNPQEIIDSLVRQFQDEEQTGRLLDSMHPLVAINAASASATTAENLYFTAASDVADDLFGVEFGDGRATRLVGRTMEQYLAGVQKRMHPAQWRAFNRNQRHMRNKLKLRAAGGEDEKQSVAVVPIVFEYHENDEYNRRAFLPIIIEDYRPRDQRFDWYSLRILYLNVTTVTEKMKDHDGEEYYVCLLDPASNARLEPLKALGSSIPFVQLRQQGQRLRNLQPAARYEPLCRAVHRRVHGQGG